MVKDVNLECGFGWVILLKMFGFSYFLSLVFKTLENFAVLCMKTANIVGG